VSSPVRKAGGDVSSPPSPLSPLPQHADEHRTERPVLLAVDQQLGEGPGLWVPSVGADRICPVEVGERQDAEQLGAGSGTEGIQSLT
jgi:hypothetical protein